MKNRLFSRVGRRGRVLLAAGLALVLLAGLAAGGYVLVHRNIQSNGIGLKPSKDRAPAEVTVYLQNDPQWSGETIGHSGYNMGGSGCLLSVAASAITQMGPDMTPQQLNEKMTAVDGFDDADFLWYKLKEAVPGVDYRYSRVFSGKTIERDLDGGLLPLVKVMYRGGGVQHWLMVVGAADGEFLVIDPLNAEKEPMPLTTTHGRVYGYRVLVPV